MEAQSNSRTPTDFLSTVLGKTVKVKLNSGIDYKGNNLNILNGTRKLNLDLIGTLACLDGYMNIALENTEEYVDGRLNNKYGDTFIRGNNGNDFTSVFENYTN